VSCTQNYRIVIPTRDSEQWIATLAEAYRALGVEPFKVTTPAAWMEPCLS
jgi:hypothetical protein